MADKYIVSLDIGTTKVCVLVARTSGEGAEITGAGLLPSKGMKKGVVVDMDAVAETIKRAVVLAEESSGVELRAAYVGVAGGHIGCRESYGATGIKGRKITRRDVDMAMESASAVYVPLDREVLHVLPVEFVIDGQGGIRQPLEMAGRRLEANVRVITASQAALENICRCCGQAGLSVIDMVFDPIASCYAVVRPREMESGVALVDMGGGTTGVAVYRDGRLWHAAVLPVGGGHITNDIAIGLKLSQEEAERVKKKYGYAVGEGSGEIETTGMDGVRRKMPRRYLNDIVLPRCEEIFELIGEEIRRALMLASSAGVVLTGGTALFKGMDRVAEAKLGLPVRMGLPENVGVAAHGEVLDGPMYSTSVGLMLYGLEAERGVYDEVRLSLRQRLKGLSRGISGIKNLVSRPGGSLGSEIRT